MSKIPTLFNRLALIGTGLIGSSIARATKAQGAAGSIVATARSPATRTTPAMIRAWARSRLGASLRSTRS